MRRRRACADHGEVLASFLGADVVQPVALGMAPVWFSVMPEDEWLDGQTQLQVDGEAHRAGRIRTADSGAQAL